MRLLAAVALTVCLLPAAEDAALFERRVRPLLVSKCQSCHGEQKQFAGLRLDSRDAILRGGLNGAAAVPGHASSSLLIKAVKHLGPKMPPGDKLSDAEIETLEKWVESGMNWPSGGAPATPKLYEKLMREHWSFQPVRPQQIPPGSQANAIDRFLDAKLKAAKLSMGNPAEKRILARRAAYVVTGLPPVPMLLNEFLSDNSESAYGSYIDKLLASPRYGEHWARHWMDVVRFAETYGYEWNYEIQGAWRYRDYLIRAFNLDLPYDKFVREHIAGDLAAKPRLNDGRNESVLATAFYRLGEMGHDNCDQFRELRTDVVDNQIDTLTKAFQGVTVACARCHDHKIDPVPTEDYYALYGILNSSRPLARTINSSPQPTAKLVALKAKIRGELARAWLNSATTIAREIQAAMATIRDDASAATIAGNIEPLRIERWRKLLNREKTDLSDPLTLIAKPGLASTFSKEAAEREAYNREKFTTGADFTQGLPPGWSSEGLGLQSGLATTGDFALTTEGSDAITTIFQAGLVTNLITDRFNGSLRSPILPDNKKFASLQILGGKFAARRVIVDNCVIGEGNELLDHSGLRWEKVSTTLAAKFPVYLELNTKTDNPRLPERPDKFKVVSDANPRSYFGISRLVYHDEDVSPKAGLSHIAPLAAEPTAETFELLTRHAIQAFSIGNPTPDQVTWLNWLVDQGLLINSRNLTPTLRALTDQYRAVEKGLAEPEIVAGMGDLEGGADHPIFIAGSALNPGPKAPRHFLSLLPVRLQPVDTRGSGRLQVANAIASADNPLTARLMVNRIWHYVFGRGLVASTDDFGRNGARPSHPELLDYLANEYVELGWSTKQMLRLMLTSDGFRQSSAASPAAAIHDPLNQLTRSDALRQRQYAIRCLRFQGASMIVSMAPASSPIE